jgi:undecaprenyl-diphosphatase
LLAGLIFCAISVAASRVLLGLHYLSDVVAGMVVGTVIGVASALLLSA